MRSTMNDHLPPHVSSFVDTVASLAPETVEVWLMGSRANGRARPESDTDLLIFGPDGFLQTLRDRLQRPENTDCLVIYDGDHYQDPWQEKNGALSELGWEKTDDRNARYAGTKWVPDKESSAEFGADMGELVERQERALRIWP
jgi:hypothetical protein